jgi:hypothetical protein
MTDKTSSHISDHTLDTLVDELIAGRTVITSEGVAFNSLPRDSRAILGWFKSNRSKWSGQNRVEYANEILNAVATDPEIRPPAVVESDASEAKRYRLSKARINRFGGLHEFGEITATPILLEIDFSPNESHSILFYGRNGSGKSSLLSAICWCLTGWFYKPQGVPANGKDFVDYYCAGQGPNTSEPSVIRLKSLPIIPMPSSAVLAELGRSKTAVESWVEVELIDDLGQSYGPFRRTMTIRNGKISESLSGDLLSLGISPADFEVGTRLPAMLPFIRLDEKNGLGEAVARLIDIQPLSDVARHAESTNDKLATQFLKPVNESLATFQSSIKASATKLSPLLIAIDPTGLAVQFAEVAVSPTLAKVDELKAVLEQRRGNSLADANALLAHGFDFADSTTQEHLIRDVTFAVRSIDPVEVANLNCAKRWQEISALSDAQLDEVSTLMQDIVKEAEALGALYLDPNRAQRIQLYAKVAAWLKESQSVLVEDCPICGQSLVSRTDSITGELIHQHIQQCLDGQSHAWDKTPRQWAQHQLGNLANNIPSLLKVEATTTPAEDLATFLSSEIGRLSCFGKVLKPLAERLSSRRAEIQSGIPTIPPARSVSFPPVLLTDCAELLARVNVTLKNIHHARWIKANEQSRSQIEALLLGPPEATTTSNETIRGMIYSLDRIIRESQPLSDLLQHVADLRKQLIDVDKLNGQRDKIVRVQAALLPLKLLRQLVEQQVKGLLTRLDARQKFWLENIYFAARLDRPEIGSPQLSNDGKLGFEATHKGTTAAAHQVTNASHLRATLVAFWLAYWEYQLESRGGLRLMLLDDPQELFDDENQLIFARGITQIVARSAQVLLATNKQQFFHDIEWRKIGAKRYEIDWRVGDLPVQLLMYREEIETLFAKFRLTGLDKDAKELASNVRVYAESRLIALFRHERPHALGDQPTLMSAVNSLRSFKNAGIQPFTLDIVNTLLDHEGCTSGTPLYSLLNDAHHSRSGLITQGRVHALLSKLDSFVKIVDDLWDQFKNAKFVSAAQLSIGRQVTRLPELPPSIEFPTRRVHVISATAAASADTVREEVTDSSAEFDWNILGGIAIYQVLSTSLGLSAPKFCRVIVSLEGAYVPDHSLVIGLTADKIFARRLSRIVKQPEIVLLNSETLDPRGRAPATVVNAESIQLLPVIGVIWDVKQPRFVPKGEAVLEAEYDLNKLNVEIAQSVRGISAEPLVLNNQTILLGGEILWGDIARFRDVPVCVEFEDGTQALKVVSDTTMGPKNSVRMLHPLGGLGEPILARGELPSKQTDFSDLPQVRRVRPMRVVLYDAAIAK